MANPLMRVSPVLRSFQFAVRHAIEMGTIPERTVEYLTLLIEDHDPADMESFCSYLQHAAAKLDATPPPTVTTKPRSTATRKRDRRVGAPKRRPRKTAAKRRKLARR